MYEYTIYSQCSIEPDHTPVYVRVPENEDLTLPVVILVHGTNGNDKHMSDPAHSESGVAKYTYNRNESVEAERDHGIQSYPGVGARSAERDPKMDKTQVESWQEALNKAGFRTVNYKQYAPGERLSQDLEQLTALLRDLFRHPSLRGRSFALLGHSRGGILARAAVVAANAQFGARRIKQVVTLHSPNQGSGLANVAVAIAAIDRAASKTLADKGIEGTAIVQAISELSSTIQL